MPLKNIKTELKYINVQKEFKIVTKLSLPRTC